MLQADELKRRIEDAGNIRRWYQKMPYLPKDYKTHFDDGKTNAFSCNYGRWTNYIKLMLNILPDIDYENATFCEVGCNAGLFLFMAWQEFSFKRLIGVEAGVGAFEQLRITKDHYHDMPLRIYKNSIGKAEPNIVDNTVSPLVMKTFPIVDVTLMSCTHYHLQYESFISYAKDLASKSLWFLVLTDENAGGVIPSDSRFVINRLIGTDVWDRRSHMRTSQDVLMYDGLDRYKNLSIMAFRSKLLKRLPVEECFIKQLYGNEANREFYGEVFPGFIQDVLDGKIDEKNYGCSSVYQWQISGAFGSTAWPPTIATERTLSYINIIKTMKDHGQEQPIDLQEHLPTVDLWDGHHRVAVLKYLGEKYIYGREVLPDVRAKCKIRRA